MWAWGDGLRSYPDSVVFSHTQSPRLVMRKHQTGPKIRGLAIKHKPPPLFRSVKATKHKVKTEQPARPEESKETG